MLAPVSLHHEPASCTRKVRDVASNRLLPPELEPTKLATAKTRPKPPLGVREITPKPSRMGVDYANGRHNRGLEEEKPSPNPLPHAGEG